MKELLPNESDNLYYLDSIGSVSEQMDWLKSLHIVEAAYCVDRNGEQSVVLIVLPNDLELMPDRMAVRTKFYQIYPSKNTKFFGGKDIVDIQQFFRNFCFSLLSSITYYKPLNSQDNEISS